MTLRIQLVREFEHSAPLSACALDRAGRYAFAGAWERNVICWDLQDGRKTLLPGPASWVIALAIPVSNQFLLAGDHVGQVLCWSLKDDPLKLVWKAQAHRGPAKAVACSADERWLATGGADGLVHLWDLNRGVPIQSFSGFSEHVEAINFHPDGKHVLATGRDCVIKGWSLETGQAAFSYSLEGLRARSATQDIEYGGGRDLAFSADGKILACCGRGGYSRPASLVLFELANGKQIQQLNATLPDSIYQATIFHPGGNILALGASGSSGEVGVWKSGQDKPLATNPLPGIGSDFALSADGQKMIVALMKSTQRSAPDRGSLAFYDVLDM